MGDEKKYSLCVACGVKPRHVSSAGVVYSRCIDCQRENWRENSRHHFDKHRAKTSREYRNELAERRETGACSKCGSLVDVVTYGDKTHRWCLKCRCEHAKQQRPASAEWLVQAERREAGLCSKCGVNPRAWGGSWCADCQNELHRKSRANSKARAQAEAEAA